jgi:hypothetical protein
VFSFSFWFIHGRLCTDHYHAPLVIFFSPLNVHFPLLITCVHNLAMCISHNNFSVCYCTWLGFFISSTHHSYYTSVINQFVSNNCFLILGFFCYRWLSFRNLRFYMQRVFFPLFFVDCLLSFFFFGLCLLMLSFALYFWWMGPHPWFLYTRFFFIAPGKYCFHQNMTSTK